jgi:L-alanine-DL-glutamate epimerase-like enolase superfamily enzyme
MGGIVHHRVEVCVEIPAAAREQAVEDARVWREAGVRLFCLGLPDTAPESLATARQVRRIVGPEALLALRLSTPLETQDAATEAGAALDRLEPYWVEGLLRDGQWRELAAVRTAVASATAAGGETLDPTRLRRALEHGSADTLTPRLNHCAGLTGLLRLADAADLYGMRVAPGCGESVLSALVASRASAGRANVGPVLLPAATARLLQQAAPDALRDGFLQPPADLGCGWPDDWRDAGETLLQFDA